MHAPSCDQHKCFLVQGKKHETNTGEKYKMPDHYRCTITCALCGKRKHYEDECYHKQRLSANLKREAQSGSGGARSERNGKKGKGKSQGRGQGKDGEQGKGGGRRGPDRKNQDKNQDQFGGSLNPTPGGINPETSGLQQKPGPTPCSQTQAQQEQGAKHGNEDEEGSNPGKRSCFLRMVRKMRKKRFDVTCPAELREGSSGGSTDLVFWYISVLRDENTWGYWTRGPLYPLWPTKLYLVGT